MRLRFSLRALFLLDDRRCGHLHLHCAADAHGMPLSLARIADKDFVQADQLLPKPQRPILSRMGGQALGISRIGRRRTVDAEPNLRRTTRSGHSCRLFRIRPKRHTAPRPHAAGSLGLGAANDFAGKLRRHGTLTRSAKLFGRIEQFLTDNRHAYPRHRSRPQHHRLRRARFRQPAAAARRSRRRPRQSQRAARRARARKFTTASPT